MFDWRRAGSWCGLAGSVIFLVCWVAAIASTPGYRFGEQWVSDLGVGGGAAYFNAGAIIAGLLTIPFAASLIMVLRSEHLLPVGCITLAGAGVALIGVGVFTENAGQMHWNVSVAFFLLVLVSLILLIFPFWKSTAMRPWGAPLTAVMVLIGCGLLAAYQAGPLTETAVVAMIIIWSVSIAWRLRVFLCVSLPRARSEQQAQ